MSLNYLNNNQKTFYYNFFFFPWAPLCLGPPQACPPYTHSPSALTTITVYLFCNHVNPFVFKYKQLKEIYLKRVEKQKAVARLNFKSWLKLLMWNTCMNKQFCPIFLVCMFVLLPRGGNPTILGSDYHNSCGGEGMTGVHTHTMGANINWNQTASHHKTCTSYQKGEEPLFYGLVCCSDLSMETWPQPNSTRRTGSGSD